MIEIIPPLEQSGFPAGNGEIAGSLLSTQGIIRGLFFTFHAGRWQGDGSNLVFRRLN